MSSIEGIADALEPLPEPDGQLGPYADSGLRTITGTRRNPRALPYYQAPVNHTDQAEVLTCHHPILDRWLQVLGGLDSDWRIEQPPTADWPITRVVPRVIPGASFPKWELPAGTYWFDYASVTASLQHLPDKPWMFQLTEKLPDGSLSLLGCIADVAHRFNLWARRHQFFEHPFARQFDAIVCPDFSSYRNDPRPQALAGERMTQQWVELGHRHGYRMIPVVSWQDREALLRQSDMLGALADAGKVNTIYIELTSTGMPRNEFLRGRLNDISEHLAHLPIRFLLSGIDAGKTVAALRGILPAGNFHMVTIWPWKDVVQPPARFAPVLPDERAQFFRQRVARLEAFHRGEGLPRPLSLDDEDAREVQQGLEDDTSP